MKVSIQEILEIFEELIAENISREDVSDWAIERRNAGDYGTLKYSPTMSKNVIWKAILYLEGVDLKEKPGSYLHTRDDFIAYKNQKLLASDY